jgi:YD repeat-containing protein
VIDAGDETHVEYDALGRKTRLLDPDTGESLYGYDGNGNLTFQSTPLGAVAWVYDALDRPTQRLHAGGLQAAWLWDTAANGLGRLVKRL